MKYTVEIYHFFFYSFQRQRYVRCKFILSIQEIRTRSYIITIKYKIQDILFVIIFSKNILHFDFNYEEKRIVI